MIPIKYNLSSSDNREIYDNFQAQEGIIKTIKGVFQGYGFKQITTAIIDNYEHFSSSNSTVLKDEIFKFISPNGDILALRPDVTIPIAKMVGCSHTLPKDYLKLFYISKVFRMDKNSSSNQREFTQAGIEYFGNSTPECDAEIIAISINALKRITANFKIEIGNPQFYKGLLEELKFSREKQREIRELIERKNFMELERVLNGLDMNDSVKEALRNIPKLYGGYEDVVNLARKLCINNAMSEALNQIKDVYEVLKDYRMEKFLTIDLGLINHMDYYTGVIFKGYLNNHGREVLSGGRYDNLTHKYGYYTPACGFAINIDEIIKGVDQMYLQDQIDWTTDYLTLYSVDKRKEAFSLAESLREKGYRVETDVLGESLRKQIEAAQAKGIKELIVLGKERNNHINIKRNTSQSFKINTFINSLGDRVVNCRLTSIH